MPFLRSALAILAILIFDICSGQESTTTFSSSAEYDPQRFEEVNIYEAGSAVFVLQSKQVHMHTYNRATSTYGQHSIFNKETLELLSTKKELVDWEYQDEEAILCGQGM